MDREELTSKIEELEGKYQKLKNVFIKVGKEMDKLQDEYVVCLKELEKLDKKE